MPFATPGQLGQGLGMLHHPDIVTGGAVPVPSRGDTLMLGTLRASDGVRGPVRAFKDDSPSLRVGDIPGARPDFPHKHVHVQGPPDKAPVPGSKAPMLYPDVHRPIDLSLTTCDIHKARPNLERFRSRRRVDPLTPRYDLPSFRERPATPPAALVHEGRVRETMEYKGLSTPRIPERNYARNPNDVSDIAFAQPNARNRTGGFTPRDVFKAVEQSGQRVLTTKCNSARQSHPLEPEYRLNTSTTNPLLGGTIQPGWAASHVGPIEGATPRVLTRDNGEPQLSLASHDVPGAVPQRFKGVVPYNMYDPPEVTPLARHAGLDCADIDGAQAGTRKAGTWTALGKR